MKRLSLKSSLTESLDCLTSSYLSVLSMSVTALDFKQGKARGLTWNLLNSFQSFIELKKHVEEFPAPDVSVTDEAFRRFTRQPSLAILRLACQLFGLSLYPDRFDLQLELLAWEGSYKAACDAAVCLNRFHFPIETFCLPLLLSGKISSMDNYMDRSPERQSQLLQFLDRLSSGEVTLNDLIFSYPSVKPNGVNKLSSKPLDKMIRKYAERWNLPDTDFPVSRARWSRADLRFWVRSLS